MKKIYTILMLLGIVVIATSQIFLWKDQAQQWQIMNTQIQMLNRLLSIQDKPFVYEDEMPENYQQTSPDQQI